MVAEPGVFATRGLESTPSMLASRAHFTCIGSDQGLRSMPAETINGEHQSRLVEVKQLACASILIANATGGDDVREIEIRLGDEIGERDFPGERCFAGCKRLACAAKGEKRRGSIDVSLGVIEVVLELEVALEELQGNLWMGAGQGAGLNAEVLFLPSRTTELLFERLFNGGIPCRVAEPVSAHCFDSYHSTDQCGNHDDVGLACVGRAAQGTFRCQEQGVL